MRTAGGAGRASLPSRTLVIGLSGCSWNVLEPLLDELPHLSAMREHGAAGTLESVVPFQTAPAWASFATGSLPETHGCLDLVVPDRDGRMRVVRGDDLCATTYYEQLGRDGRRSVLVNLPIDQGGSENAVIVNSWLTLDEARRIFPLGRRERYRRLLDAQRTVPADPQDLDEICAVDAARFDLVRELCLHEDWDHFFVLFSATDWLGHAATGSFLAGDAGARRAFLRLYRQLDNHIGWLLEHSGAATAFVLSEHGQAEERAILRVNAILDGMGLIETLPGSRRVDTARSRAFSPTDASFAVYVREPSRLDEIAEALADLAEVETVWKTGGEPALLFAPAAGVRTSAAVMDSAVGVPARAGLGCHQRDGILLVQGAGVAASTLERASLRDVAPTLLWLMGAPLPSTVDGRVIREAFAPNERPIALRGGHGQQALVAAGDGDEDTVTRRLKALGYI
jgi:predicted AlkP superfamily phosphohydrolase/phosphomutase